MASKFVTAEGKSVLLGSGVDGSSDHMLGIPFDRGCQRQGFLLIDPSRCRDPDHSHLPKCQGAGFIEDDGIDLPSLLKSQPVAHQDAVVGAHCGRNGNNQRNSQPEACGQAITRTVATRATVLN
jgi:hypothetical protein